MLSGQFPLASGATSDTYFDKYRFEADPGLLMDVARAMKKMLPGTDVWRKVDVVAGLELGGIPVVTALSRETGKPAAFVRKERKRYGTRRIVEGSEVSGKLVIVVEDVITTAGTVVRAVESLRAEGAIVDTVLCVVDREQGGTNVLSGCGCVLKSLFTLTSLAESAARPRRHSSHENAEATQ